MRGCEITHCASAAWVKTRNSEAFISGKIKGFTSLLALSAPCCGKLNMPWKTSESPKMEVGTLKSTSST
jgi:hypothetical protein